MNTIWLAEHLVASTQPVPQPKSTPLLEALKAEKSANKDKEAILRNHAHYSQIIPPGSRKEDKKKTIPVPQPQASKASEGTLATDSGSGPKCAADSSVTEATKPAKPPRAPRAPRVAKNQSNNPSQNATVDDAAAAPSEAPARRSRPVIGLASRQFEAALSGVGARERRAKRERGKEKESPAPAGNDNGPSSEAAPTSSSVAVPLKHGASATGSDAVEPLPSSSPKKERTRRSGRGGGGASGAPPVKISGILQRVDTAPPAAIEQGEGLVNNSVNSTTGVVGGGNRGGRRGRGRGAHT